MLDCSKTSIQERGLDELPRIPVMRSSHLNLLPSRLHAGELANGRRAPCCPYSYSVSVLFSPASERKACQPEKPHFLEEKPDGFLLSDVVGLWITACPIMARAASLSRAASPLCTRCFRPGPTRSSPRRGPPWSPSSPARSSPEAA